MVFQYRDPVQGVVMKVGSFVAKVVVCAGLLAVSGMRLEAQTIQPLESIKNQEELNQTILALDTALFDAYNKCDLDKFAVLIADDVEFYHDNGGVTLGKDKFVDSVRKNICGTDTQRELVPGTFEAHYMKGYGAIEIGTHRFLHAKTNGATGEGRFITLWQCKDGVWKVARALSFDHHEVKK
jgi:ketosteroid isomerase-like protein